MPRAARVRVNQKQPLYAESDTEEDEQTTPVPAHRKRPKKRASEVFVPTASGSGDGARQPLKSVNINDDAAEKRQRRKSTKIVALVQDDEAMEDDADGTNNTPKAAKQKLLLSSVVDAPAVPVSFDVMSSNFEEWMKMATDNKINAANSWNFALIDYFHDMSLLRNTTDNSINFQRASCTLDGCVKIWTSRVDSVGTETGKLLSNLASEGKGDRDDDDDDDEGNGSDGEKQRKKRKAHRAEGSTLAKSAAQLQSKKLELEHNVDPLFKKTCADFDEGGAQGLLMNHLSLGMGPDGGMRVVFDAGDSMGRDEEDEADLEEPEERVDITHLRKEFLPDMDALDLKAISHSLADFSFSKDGFSFDEATFMNATYRDDSDSDDGFGDAPMDADGPFDQGVPGDGGDVHDFFTGDQAVMDDFGGGFGGGMDDMGMDDDRNGDGGPGGADGEYAQGGHQAGARPVEPFDPRRAPNERDLVLAMTDGGGGMFDYFDQTFRKNWAGPEHWKLRKVIRRPDPTDAAAPKQRREKKEAFKIDFLSPPEKDRKELEKEIFAPVTGRGASITLPGYGKKRKGKEKEKEKRDDQTLPDDMHFSSRQLVTLFLKPKFSLRMRGHGQRLDPQAGEVDENFWAQAAADQAAGRVNEDDMDETANGGAIPFNTQFFHDDYDDGPGFDDLYDGDAGGPDVPLGAAEDPAEQDLLALTQGETRRVRPEHINYAKRAKRVDVRKLKTNIWKGLNIVVDHRNEEDNEDEDAMDTDDRPPRQEPTDPEEAREFTSVLSGLRKTYPQDKMEEISTSFCFICLLHLANEQGLKIEDQGLPMVSEDVAEGNSTDRKVGELWNLKIFRDPDATAAA